MTHRSSGSDDVRRVKNGVNAMSKWKYWHFQEYGEPPDEYLVRMFRTGFNSGWNARRKFVPKE